jgi:hypothetical protein
VGKQRKSSLEADDPSVPDWPDEKPCEDCGVAVWIVSDSSGDDVAINARPMDTQVIADVHGKVRIRARGSYRFDEARREGGYSMPEPVRVTDLVHEDDPERDFAKKEAVRFEWITTRVQLTVDNDEPLYSEHRLTCSATTEKFLDAMLPEFAGDVWDEVPTNTALPKRVQKTLRVKRLVEARPELIVPWRMFRELDLIDDVTGPNRQMGLWWRPEMAKPKAVPVQQEVLQPQLSLFRGGRDG